MNYRVAEILAKVTTRYGKVNLDEPWTKNISTKKINARSLDQTAVDKLMESYTIHGILAFEAVNLLPWIVRKEVIENWGDMLTEAGGLGRNNMPTIKLKDDKYASTIVQATGKPTFIYYHTLTDIWFEQIGQHRVESIRQLTQKNAKADEYLSAKYDALGKMLSDQIEGSEEYDATAAQQLALHRQIREHRRPSLREPVWGVIMYDTGACDMQSCSNAS